jgi:hypothetical protein
MVLVLGSRNLTVEGVCLGGMEKEVFFLVVCLRFRFMLYVVETFYVVS